MTDDYELIAVGDSAMWGMGLDHEDKYVSRFHRYLNGTRFPEENLKAQVGAVLGILEDPDRNELDVDEFDTYVSEFELEPSTVWDTLYPISRIRRFEQTFALSAINDFDDEAFREPLTELERYSRAIAEIDQWPFNNYEYNSALGLKQLVKETVEITGLDASDLTMDDEQAAAFDEKLERLADLSGDRLRELYLIELLDWSDNERRSIAQKHGRMSTDREGRKGVGHGTPTITQQLENLPYDYTSDGAEEVMAEVNLAVDPGEAPLTTSALEDERGLESDKFVATYAASGGSESDVDVVVMNGSINDLGSTNPLDIGFDYKTRVDHATRSFSYIGLKRTIRRTHEKYPGATIIVCGYFPPLSRASKPEEWDLIRFIIENTDGIIDSAIRVGLQEEFSNPAEAFGFAALSVLWSQYREIGETITASAVDTEIRSLLREVCKKYEYSYKKMTFEMRRAVAELDAELDVPILFVNPGFKPENATESEDPWLFGLPEFSFPTEGLDAPVYFDPDEGPDFEDDTGIGHEEYQEIEPYLDPSFDGATEDGNPLPVIEALMEVMRELAKIDIATPHLVNYLAKNLVDPVYGAQDEVREKARKIATRVSNHDTGYQYRNATAHPNQTGATQYYGQLCHTWDRNFEDGWSLRTACERLRSDGESTDCVHLRDAIERYEPLLNLADGVRACFNMTRVDSIKIELETGSVGIDGNFERTHLDIQIGDEEFVRFNLNPDPDHSLTQGAVRRRSPGDGHPNAPNVLQGVPEERDHLVIDPIFDDAKVVTGSERATDLDSPGSNELYTNSEPLQVGDIEGISIHWGDEIDEDAMEAHELQNSPEGPLIVGWTVANGTLWINGRVVGELDEAVFGVTVPDIEGDSQAVGTTVSFESVFDS